ncbi:30S ribosome-binding factor RbfA [Silvibacterium dinghuense]|uniref:Ribosome-binding factor A n=1 Tax=Silvibacterium dinghuense TaxID=1560006 RepID=A0A4Q1SIB3_9BACT|nr:30S ribosome-binding factor RbfA [Silvibacterium dinghuense]RXS97341.1 30S ribosome-binding factor RbfA [Silvibacterium dinghuense]GGG98199.1 ribosome-binding factor A [Silvibacterium dinghuense]
MPEQRARKYHQDRVAETLREEIGAMIEGELSDPRIASAYVTQVLLNPGGKSALIYVAVDDSAGEVQDIEAREKGTIEGLMAARGYIRHELLERMGVRHVPELMFHIDRSERMTARVEELLERQKRRQKKTAEAH